MTLPLDLESTHLGAIQRRRIHSSIGIASQRRNPETAQARPGWTPNEGLMPGCGGSLWDDHRLSWSTERGSDLSAPAGEAGSHFQDLLQFQKATDSWFYPEN